MRDDVIEFKVSPESSLLHGYTYNKDEKNMMLFARMCEDYFKQKRENCFEVKKTMVKFAI
jgi:hypothetical protein